MDVDSFLAHLRGHGRPQDPAPRRRDPLPPPRRLLGQRHGRLEGARGRRSWRSAGGWPPSAASPTATSAPPMRTGPTASSRWPTAARRRSATRSSTRSPTTHGLHGDDRATLYSSTEYKKIRLHYFTDDYAALGGALEHSSLGRADGARSARALRPRGEGPSRRGQLAGPGDAPDRPRPDLHRARRGLRAGRRRRQPLRRLGRLLGPADPRPRPPGGPRGRQRGRRAAAPATAPRPRPRSSSPRRWRAAFPRSRWCG